MKKQAREPIATWWRIDTWKPKIEPVDVVAFSGSFVTRLGTWNCEKREFRERRDNTFPTFAEAKAVAVARAARNIINLKRNIEDANSFLAQLNSLKEELWRQE